MAGLSCSVVAGGKEIFMKKQQAEQAPAVGAPEASYAPKQYSTSEQVLFAIKLGGGIAALVLALWLMETYL
jgi:hypothetical protein